MQLVFTSHGSSRSTSIILCDWLFAVLNCLDKTRSEEFYSKVCRLIRDEDEMDLQEVFLLLINNADGVFEVLEAAENKEIVLREDVKRKYGELYKESEEFFISLLSMLVNPKLSPNKSKECRDLFLDILISGKKVPSLRISVLKTYYDTFEQDYDLLVKILRYVYENENLSTFGLPYTLFENIERKVISNLCNNSNVDVRHKRDIYISLFNIVNKCDNNNYLNKKSYGYLRLYIETFNTRDDVKRGDANTDLIECGIRFIISSIIIQDILFFDSIVSLPLVDYIKHTQSDNSETKTLFKLLDICLNGKVSDYYDGIQGTSEYKKLVEKYKDIGDCESNIVCKLRLLTISTLAKDRESISLAELQNEFRLSAFDTQDMVVHAISIGLITGFISEDSDTLHISCTTKRKFGDEEWDALNNKISNWISHLKNLSSLLVNSTSNTSGNSGNGINATADGEVRG
ncbi:proteasome regulatory complex component with a PINT domain at the C-terminus [Cryptosporidium ryanae]|uniref:proteasome regulatory complex component with a PINT domain at the C-terminus n=1 Tax=Cryptosporidium ryanae TaxID=515981 RepID=UPI003519E241|nr:proteasome regulatory complex component with a PINT domain at the C-terminus [Cryptosporidium ryanae]